jgi:hypothetical protein
MGLSTTYTKVETDFKLQELQKLSLGGLKGTLKTTDTAPTTQGLYILSDIGTYTNLGGLVTTAGKLNYAYFDSTTWKLIATDMPKGTDGKTIEDWSAKTFPIGSSVYYNGKIYYNATTAAASTDVPSVSAVWVEKNFVNPKKILTTERLTDNPAGLIYSNLNEIPWSQNISDSYGASKSVVDISAELPSFNSTPYFYQKAVKLAMTVGGASPVMLSLAFKIKYSPKIKFAYWLECNKSSDTASTPFGADIVYKKGYNDMTVATFSCMFRNSDYANIKSAINSNGFWQKSGTTGFNVIVRKYLEIDGRFFVLLESEVTTAPANDADYIEIQMGCRNWYYLSNTTESGRLMWGFQIVNPDVADIEYHNYIDKYKTSAIKDVIFDRELEKSAKDNDYEINHAIDAFNGGRRIYQAKDGAISDSVKSYLQISTGFILTKIGRHKKFSDGFKITHDSGVIPFSPTSTTGFFFNLTKGSTTTYQNENRTFMFWIDRTTLNNNKLAFLDSSGAVFYLSQSELLTKGFVESRVETINTPSIPIMEVLEVDGDFSCVKINMFYFPTTGIKLAITSESGTPVTEIKIYNPTLIYNKNPNPWVRYKSLAEINNSSFIGKTFALIGDSQYNDEVVANQLVSEFGVNIIKSQYGGHSMAIRGYQLGATNYNSFYHKDLRFPMLDNGNIISLWIFTTSTNDGAGGGDISQSAVQYVLDNYPAYGDDATTQSNKMGLFNSLTPSQVNSSFGYKQTYSAYIKQILNAYPDARIICCSIPISVSSYLTGATDANGKGVWASGKNPDVARTELTNQYQSISNDSKAVAEKYNANWVDNLNNVGLTFENATNFIIDGTHWNEKLKKRIAGNLVQEINKLKNIL